MMPPTRIPKNRMHFAGQFLAVLGLILIGVGLVSPVTCISDLPANSDLCQFAGNQSLFQPDPFDDADFEWQLWVGRNIEALIIAGAAFSILMGIIFRDRIGMLMGGFALLATITIIFGIHIIELDDNTRFELWWGWLVLLGGSAFILFGAVPASQPSTYDLQQGRVKRPSSSMIARFLGLVGVVAFLLGATVLPQTCNRDSSGACDIAGDNAPLQWEAFDSNFDTGYTTNAPAIILISIGTIAFFAALIGRAGGLATIGLAALGVAGATFAATIAGLDFLELDIVDNLYIGWVGLFGGGFLMLIAAIAAKMSYAEPVGIQPEWFQHPPGYPQGYYGQLGQPYPQGYYAQPGQQPAYYQQQPGGYYQHPQQGQYPQQPGYYQQQPPPGYQQGSYGQPGQQPPSNISYQQTQMEQNPQQPPSQINYQQPTMLPNQPPSNINYQQTQIPNQQPPPNNPDYSQQTLYNRPEASQQPSSWQTTPAQPGSVTDSENQATYLTPASNSYMTNPTPNAEDELTFRVGSDDSVDHAETLIENPQGGGVQPTSFANKPQQDEERTFVDPNRSTSESNFRTTMDSVSDDDFAERTERFSQPSPFRRDDDEPTDTDL